METGHILWIAGGKKKQVVYDFIEHVGLEWMDNVEATNGIQNPTKFVIEPFCFMVFCFVYGGILWYNKEYLWDYTIWVGMKTFLIKGRLNEKYFCGQG